MMREVTIEEGKEFAKVNNAIFIEVSAKIGTKIDNIFTELVQVLNNSESQLDTKNVILKESEFRTKKEKKFGDICCK